MKSFSIIQKYSRPGLPKYVLHLIWIVYCSNQAFQMKCLFRLRLCVKSGSNIYDSTAKNRVKSNEKKVREKCHNEILRFFGTPHILLMIVITNTFQGFKWKRSSESNIMIKARASLYAGFDNDQLCCCAGVQTHATSTSKVYGSKSVAVTAIRDGSPGTEKIGTLTI